jgi:predicted N-acetyltransferase YhbS
VPHRRQLLDRVERYFAAAPLPDARIQAAGALDVPIGDPAWPYPARPRPGAGPVSADDVRAAVAAQEAADLPPALEWVCETSPGLAAAARAAGLEVDERPLLVADEPVDLVLPAEVRLYLVGADDPQLPRYLRLREAALASAAGTDDVAPSAGEPGPDDEAGLAVLRERIAAGRTVMMVAVEDGAPVAVGTHQPVDIGGAEVSEITGLATSPRRRGRGLGAGLASALVAHARETADTVFLTAGDDDVARIYERVGFARLGTTGVAEPAGSAG